MKRLISILLAICIMATFVACGNKTTDADVKNQETTKKEDVITEENIEKEDDKVTEDKKEEQKDDKEDKKPAEKPSEEPAEKPVEKPVEKPDTTPKTLGNKLLAEFKTKAASGMGTLEIAEALVTNEAISFMGGAMPVEEGLLSGFDNYEVKGFKSGAVFMPMIGSIPFIGYVFELNNASEASAFISNLKANANLRWNICVTADEMVTGSHGNKVFFVMCPTSLEE